MKTEEPGGTFVNYRFEENEGLSIQFIGASNGARLKILDEQRFVIQGEGDRFSETNIRRDTLAAFFYFIATYDDALRRLT